MALKKIYSTVHKKTRKCTHTHTHTRTHTYTHTHLHTHKHTSQFSSYVLFEKNLRYLAKYWVDFEKKLTSAVVSSF